MPPRAPVGLSRFAGLPSAFNQTSLRCLHSSRPGHASFTSTEPYHQPPSTLFTQQAPTKPSPLSPLECLPLSQVLRTYLITSISSSPTLLAACTGVLTRLLNSKSWLTSVEKNPILRLGLRETFYKQFCAGENKVSTRKTAQQLNNIGYHGVVLEYALEVLRDVKGADEAKDVAVWRRGLLDSIDMARPGDFVAFKWSGLGGAAFHRMEAGEDPSPLMDAAMREICDAATAKTVYLLPSAEETSTLPTFHKWTLQMSDIYNRGPAGAIIYNTYQAYLRQTPATISQHLQEAQKAGYTLGIKLVRGAYMGTEPRQLIWGSAEETHNAYDSVTSAVLRRKFDGLLPSPADSKTFPPVHVVLATHNAVSTRKAQAIRKQQLQDNEPLVPLMYAQLQGMADEISCELLAEARVSQSPAAPKVYKYTPWGTMTQCLGYLLRRAGENKDAAGRTLESRIAMGQELWRRFRALFGFA